MESRAADILTALGLAGVGVVALMCSTPAGAALDLVRLPMGALFPIADLCAGYSAAVLVLRKLYTRRHESLL